MRSELLHIATALAAALAIPAAMAGVTADEATKLKSELTPMGAEKAGNKDGSIPAWTGGLTTPTPGFKNGGRRPDPFAGDKPVLTIDAEQHADKLTDGTKALLKKYPDSFRLEVYKTLRTAAAPQSLYDNTLKNATRVTMIDGGAGGMPKGAFGGIPFPIPKNGLEAIWNAQLRWRGESWVNAGNAYQVTGEGKVVLVQKANVENYVPYYAKDGSPDNFSGEYWLVRATNSGPPIRAGEAILGRENIDETKSASWVYLTGQRRVRKLPNACCDTPAPFAAGVVSFDEIEGFTGRLDRFDWKLVGKKEIYIPYNANRIMQPAKDADVVGPRHLNPEHLRWELHRVWIVDAALKPGQRHTSPKGRYYLDEDTWTPVLIDRWDANGQLWRTQFSIPVAMPDLPGVVGGPWGTYELLTGAYYVNNVFNEQASQYRIVSPRLPDATFSPDALAGEGVR